MYRHLVWNYNDCIQSCWVNKSREFSYPPGPIAVRFWFPDVRTQCVKLMNWWYNMSSEFSDPSDPVLKSYSTILFSWHMDVMCETNEHLWPSDLVGQEWCFGFWCQLCCWTLEKNSPTMISTNLQSYAKMPLFHIHTFLSMPYFSQIPFFLVFMCNFPYFSNIPFTMYYIWETELLHLLSLSCSLYITSDHPHARVKCLFIISWSLYYSRTPTSLTSICFTPSTSSISFLAARILLRSSSSYF